MVLTDADLARLKRDMQGGNFILLTDLLDTVTASKKECSSWEASAVRADRRAAVAEDDADRLCAILAEISDFVTGQDREIIETLIHLHVDAVESRK